MNIEQIDLGENYLRTCSQGSERLVIGFESGGGKVHRPEPNRPAWGQKLVANAGWDGLHILPKVMNWYQSPELWAALGQLQDIGFFGNYKDVVMYGNSMGGFGALAFAKIAKAKRVVAFSPRSTLRWKTLPWGSRFSKKLEYNRVGPRADALNGLAPGIEVKIFVDPFFARDRNHANRIALHHEHTEVIRVPFARHSIPEYLDEEGILGKTTRAALAGEFDKEWFYQAIRGRRETATYQKHFQQRVLKRGQR